jgi:hypothetical protein
MTASTDLPDTVRWNHQHRDRSVLLAADFLTANGVPLDGPTHIARHHLTRPPGRIAAYLTLIRTRITAIAHHTRTLAPAPAWPTAEPVEDLFPTEAIFPIGSGEAAISELALALHREGIETGYVVQSGHVHPGPCEWCQHEDATTTVRVAGDPAPDEIYAIDPYVEVCATCAPYAAKQALCEQDPNSVRDITIEVTP